MDVRADNYYSREADTEYFSVTQYKQMMTCEAAAMARLRGEYEPPPTKALLIGQYVDCWFEGTLDDFKAEHAEIFTKQGTLKAEYRQAEQIIDTVRQYPLFMRFMSGEKQKILTFELFGAKWKMKMDSFIPDTCITDLKIVRTAATLPTWRYDIQGAIYQKGCELNGLGVLPFYLAVATKESVTDVHIYQIPQSVLDLAMREIEANMPRLIDVKNGVIEAERCGECDYCKRTRELTIENYVNLLE